MKYVINGGRPLYGTVTVGGAKNAVLPILCACLLCTEGTVTLTGCPDISDVTYTLEILEMLGCDVSFDHGQITVNAQNAAYAPLDCEQMSRLRSTALFLGASTGRFGRAEQCLPGGCELGARPVDMHLAAFSDMQLRVTTSEKSIKCEGCTRDTDIFLKFPSVGATENIILAAAVSNARVTVRGAAREPEIVDLQNFINAMGAKVTGAGSDTIIIEGVEKLRAITYNIIGDRIEASTYIAAALMTDGEITVKNVNFQHIGAFVDFAVSVGGAVVISDGGITVSRASPLLFGAERLVTAPYPGFATDAQSAALALLSVCYGKSVVEETVFSDRLRLAYELEKMGADITVVGNKAYLRGVSSLCGAHVTACDLRSGAALVVAALGARGKSKISGIHHILRGYQNFDNTLRSLGADIIKTEE